MVDDVLARAMAKSPEDRFASAREFVAALDAALGQAMEPADVPRAGTSRGVPRAAQSLAQSLLRWCSA